MINKDHQNLFECNLSLDDLKKNPQWKELLTSEVFVYQLLNLTSFDDFESLPKELLNKPAIILSSLEKFFLNQKNIPENLSQDVSFCMYCCKLEPKYAKLFNSLMDNNAELTLWYINEFKSVPISQFLPQKYCSDEKYAQILIKNNINNYAQLGQDLRNDLTIYQALSFPDRVKIYKHSGSKIQSNWQLSSEVILKDPSCYQYADLKLQKDPNFYLNVLSKISDKSFATHLLLSAHQTIQDNEHCVWQTALISPESLSMASERLLNSTSFAQQVISGMNATQINESFESWTVHVRNNGAILEDLLPQIVKSNSLINIGPALKENFGFMLKSILLDSKQTLEVCAPNLLSRADFIINAYHCLDEKNLHKDRYDETSEQSGVFDYIPQKATENADFLINLYREFKDIFVSIVYPKVKNFDTTLVHYLNACNQVSNGLNDALDKMLLKDDLQNQLTNNHIPKKKPKI